MVRRPCEVLACNRPVIASNSLAIRLQLAWPHELTDHHDGFAHSHISGRLNDQQHTGQAQRNRHAARAVDTLSQQALGRLRVEHGGKVCSLGYGRQRQPALAHLPAVIRQLLRPCHRSQARPVAKRTRPGAYRLEIGPRVLQVQHRKPGCRPSFAPHRNAHTAPPARVPPSPCVTRTTGVSVAASPRGVTGQRMRTGRLQRRTATVAGRA